MAANTCTKHPTRLAKTNCIVCKAAICNQCTHLLAKHPYCSNCFSSALEDAMKTADAQAYGIYHERRQFKRIHIIRAVVAITEGRKAVKGVIINMSIGDMGILFNEAVKENTTIMLKSVLFQDEEYILQAGVVRTEKIGDFYYTAATLMNLGDNREKIANFLSGKQQTKFVKIKDKISFV